MPEFDWKSVAALTSVALLWITKSVWEPFLKGYTEQRGKQLATSEDIEKVLQELKATTAAVETVRVSVSALEWDRQWRLDQKRDAYIRLVSSMEHMRTTNMRLHDLRQAASDPTVIATAKTKYDDAILDFQTSRSLARLFCNVEAVRVAGYLVNPLRKIELEDTPEKERFEAAHNLIRNARRQVTEQARLDLGLD